ncbi:pinensin family lanthipeptide [Longimicrobium sp.]|uniref:pinensin family lanthipeptide n=1 Tax=Longimicrobium sp. TaxID=2029185 RepID=UPI003B3A8F3B
MKKLSLKMDDLRVASFVTDVAAEERGTVHGAQITRFCTRHECVEPSQPGYATYVNNICIRC